MPAANFRRSWMMPTMGRRRTSVLAVDSYVVEGNALAGTIVGYDLDPSLPCFLLLRRLRRLRRSRRRHVAAKGRGLVPSRGVGIIGRRAGSHKVRSVGAS
eukprot:scaffold6644_cov124-Pinguiococcus_pyrenoidosus.AAC.1